MAWLNMINTSTVEYMNLYVISISSLFDILYSIDTHIIAYMKDTEQITLSLNIYHADNALKQHVLMLVYFPYNQTSPSWDIVLHIAVL